MAEAIFFMENSPQRHCSHKNRYNDKILCSFACQNGLSHSEKCAYATQLLEAGISNTGISYDTQISFLENNKKHTYVHERHVK